jgi:hypothetical protein
MENALPRTFQPRTWYIELSIIAFDAPRDVDLQICKSYRFIFLSLSHTILAA